MSIARRIYDGQWPSTDRLFNTGGPDPYSAYTKFILQPRSTDTVPKDYAQNATMTYAGSVSVRQRGLWPGYASMYLSGNSYIYTGTQAGSNLSNLDFTIELVMEIAPSSSATGLNALSSWDAPSSRRGWSIAVSTTSQSFSWSTNGANSFSVSGAFPIAKGTKIYAVAERYQGVLSFYVNGALAATNSIGTTSIADSLDIVEIDGVRGETPTGDYYFYFARTTVGAARFQGRLPPGLPPRPQPTISQTAWDT